MGNFHHQDYNMLDQGSFAPFGMLEGQQSVDLDGMYPMRTLNQALYHMDSIYVDGLAQTSLSEPNDWAHWDDGPGMLQNETTSTINRPSGDAASQPSPMPLAPSHQPSRPIRYPVLQPLAPWLKSAKISQGLASDLLEHFFASSFKSTPHPVSPYLLGFVFSKGSFLTSERPRDCRPALLASMLWLSAHTCYTPALSSNQTSRARTCQKLLDLTLQLLSPLVHYRSMSNHDVTHQQSSGRAGARMFGASVDQNGPMTQGNLDDVATYMHLAIIVSAGEDKSASLRWWTAAWSLANELKLGHELPTNAVPEASRRQDANSDSDQFSEDDIGDTSDQEDTNASTYTEQEREERRRLWWLLYIVDRHLALCYNRPLILQDRSCEGLLRPMDERSWHTGNFNVTHTNDLGALESQALSSQDRQASRFRFTGPSIFAYFLPLMAMLGEIVDLVQACNHPFLGQLALNTGLFDAQTNLVSQQLQEYMQSLQAYRSMHLGHDFSQRQSTASEAARLDGTPKPRLDESQIEIVIASAYGTHIMHVLHLLLTGRWDPIELLDDDSWIATPSFLNSTSHAVDGSEAVLEILEYDPELNFMPFLYGIYLLHGSFLLLLVADRLQERARPDIVKACTTMVRAHEACVVTLNTEYQVCLLRLPKVPRMEWRANEDCP